MNDRTGTTLDTRHAPGPDQGPERVPIGAVGIDRLDLAQIKQRFIRWVEEGSPHQVATVNLQFVGTAARDKVFARIVNHADLVVADGVPLLWVSRLLGMPIPRRITGHDLVHLAAALAADRGYSVSFLGGTPQIAEAAASRLCAMHPGLDVKVPRQGSFSSNGYGLSRRDEAGLIKALSSAPPHFLFVALGCPKQEFWIAHHLEHIGVPVCIGVGGVLDVLAGRRQRAPVWAQQTGLEWFYRLYQEPRRLGKRYLLGDAPTFARLAASVLLQRGRRRTF